MVVVVVVVAAATATAVLLYVLVLVLFMNAAKQQPFHNILNITNKYKQQIQDSRGLTKKGL